MWFLLSLFFAFWSSIGVSIAKRVLKNTDVLVFIAFGNLLSAIAVGTFLFFRGIPQVDSVFWINIAIAAGLGILVNISYISAIKIAPISLTMPMAAATPVVATISGFLLRGETTTVLKLLGVLTIVFGAYLLNISEIKNGIIEPLKALFKNRGVQLMLLAQALVGLTPVFEKNAIFHTTPREPLMVSFASLLFLSGFFFPFMFARIKNPLAQFKRNFWWFVLPAPIGALAAWAVFTAYSLTNIGYVTAILKLSMLFTILWGALFFKEERIKERLLGASVMVLGTILLVI
ncbi:MAG: DMT family transporter [bacterium]|nr:DMT family transporter [bacterium]